MEMRNWISSRTRSESFFNKKKVFFFNPKSLFNNMFTLTFPWHNDLVAPLKIKGNFYNMGIIKPNNIEYQHVAKMSMFQLT